MRRRSSLSTFTGPDLSPGWQDVVIVFDGFHYKPTVRYGAIEAGEFYYHCIVLNEQNPQILLQEVLLN